MKYARDKAIKLRDVIRLAHPKPGSEEQSALWKRLVNDELKTPDTWEVAISACGGNKGVFKNRKKYNIGSVAQWQSTWIKRLSPLFAPARDAEGERYLIAGLHFGSGVRFSPLPLLK